MAGWVGLLITGLNMLPVSQLDGGHITYALFGKRAHLIARGVVMIAVVFVVAANAYMWSLMLILLLILGVDHPPTSNDRAPLGLARRLLGLTSLAIPIFCFPPMGMSSYTVKVPATAATQSVVEPAPASAEIVSATLANEGKILSPPAP